VALLDRIFEPRLGNLQAGLSKATQRHALLVANLANLNTPGYQRQDMDFAVELDRAAGRRIGPPQASRDAGGAQRFDGNSVDLEREIVGLAETELRYAMLTEITNRFFSGLKNAIAEGRR
jgi:flagellar basal-body rod protein FlgB